MQDKDLQALSDATVTLEESLRETIEALQDVLIVFKEWNAELEAIAKDGK